jgi:hypothetical protein
MMMGRRRNRKFDWAVLGWGASIIPDGDQNPKGYHHRIDGVYLGEEGDRVIRSLRHPAS